jgi:hypothetical protein
LASLSAYNPSLWCWLCICEVAGCGAKISGPPSMGLKCLPRPWVSSRRPTVRSRPCSAPDCVTSEKKSPSEWSYPLRWCSEFGLTRLVLHTDIRELDEAEPPERSFAIQHQARRALLSTMSEPDVPTKSCVQVAYQVQSELKPRGLEPERLWKGTCT